MTIAVHVRKGKWLEIRKDLARRLESSVAVAAEFPQCRFGCPIAVSGGKHEHV